MLTVEDIRNKAAELHQSTGSAVSISDVATGLGCTKDYCKRIISDARKTQPISWHELGIQSGNFSKERKILFELNTNLTSQRAKILAISCLLELVQKKEITPLGSRVLVYAIMTGESSYERLDIPYTERHNLSSEAVRGVLHNVKIAPRKTLGLIGDVQRELTTLAHKGRKGTPIEIRSRAFMADCISLFREHAEHRLFNTFLETKKPSIASMQKIGAVVQQLLQRQWPNEILIQEHHLTVLRQLIDDKAAGNFRSLLAFTKSHDLGYSAVAKLLKGSSQYLSLNERILRGAERLGIQPIDPLQSALAALQKEKSLSAEQAGMLRDAVDAHQGHQKTMMMPTEALALEKLFELKALGRKISLVALGRACNMQSASTYYLIYGRDNPARAGCIAVINQALHKLPEAERRALIDDFVPYNLKAHRQPLMKLAELRPMNEKTQQLKERLISTVIAIIQEKEKLPGLRIKAKENGVLQPRLLTRSELGELINHFFGSCAGSTTELSRNLTSILSSRAPLEADESRLRVFLKGHRIALFERASAIVTFRNALSPLLPTIASLNQHGEAAALDSSQLMEQIHDWSLIGWAQRIALAPDAFQSVRTVGVFCATRPHTLRELVRLASRTDPTHTTPGSPSAYSILYKTLSTSPLLLTDSSVPMQFEESLTKLSHLLKHQPQFELLPLLTAARQRGVAIEHFAIFLENLYANPRFIEGYGLIEEVAQIAYGKNLEAHRASEKPYALRVFNRFLQRSLSAISAYTLPDDTKANFPKLLELAEQNVSQQTDNDRRIAQMVEKFFKTYSVEAVIRKYCSYLIQSPANPRGVPYDRLLETAYDGVYEAAQRYDPDSRLEAGKPVATFNTVAVSTIRWNAIGAAKKYALDASRAPIHLEDRIGGEDSEGNFGALLAAPVQMTDMQTEIEAELAIKALEALPPIAKRVVELRFVLSEQMKNEEEPSYREIGEILFKERLTDHVLSSERIRQILDASLLKLRQSAFSGSAEEWNTFFVSVAQREAPRPIVFEVVNKKMRLAQGVELSFDDSELGKSVVTDITRIYQSGAREFEILLRARTEHSLEEIGLYEVMVEKEKVTCCERIQ